MTSQDIRAAVCHCLIQDLRKTFRDSVFVAKIYKAYADPDERVVDRIEVIIKYETRDIRYVISICLEALLVYSYASSHSYCLGEEAFDINEPDFSDVAVRVTHIITRDMIAYLDNSYSARVNANISPATTFIRESFAFNKSQTDQLVTKGRLSFILHSRITPIELEEASEYNPIATTITHYAEIIIDDILNRASGVFALSLNSKMKQVGVINRGYIENLHLEEPGIYEIILDVLPFTGVDQQMARPDRKYSR